MTQHTTSAWDDTPLYYELHGLPVGEAPAVVLCDGIGCDGFIWKYLTPWLSERYTVLHGHYRGHGRSGKAPSMDHYSIADTVKDLFTVMDDAGVESGLLFGHSMGVQVTIEAALSAPERVNGLSLLCGSFGRPLDTWHDHAMLKSALPRMQWFMSRFGGLVEPALRRLMPTSIGWLFAQGEVDGALLRREDFIPYLEHLSKMDSSVFLRMLEEASKHTTEDRLQQLDRPVLIVGGERDKFTPFWVSEVLESHLPNAELHMVRGGTHTIPLEHRKLTEMLIDSWLSRNALAEPVADEPAYRASSSSS